MKRDIIKCQRREISITYRHVIGTKREDKTNKTLRNSQNNNIKKQDNQTLPASILYPKNRAAIKTANTETDARAITIVSSR